MWFFCVAYKVHDGESLNNIDLSLYLSLSFFLSQSLFLFFF